MARSSSLASCSNSAPGRSRCPNAGWMGSETAALGTPSESARCDAPLELTADMGLAELPLKYLRPRLALLEVGEDRVSEIAKEEHVWLAQPRPLLVGQTAEYVEAGVESG